MNKKVFLCCLAALVCLGMSAKTDFLKGKILKIESDDFINEQGGSSLSIGPGGISTSSSISLLGIERALEKAAEDDDIAMIFLNVDHFSAGVSACEEIREHLTRFSAKGKPVVAYAASLGNASYYIGSAADRFFLHPQGSGSLNGLSSTQFFLKDLLDTLGVNIQLIRHGKFKSAGEMYIRNDISPENREQYETMLNSLWSTMVEEMAASRGVSADSLNAWSNSLALGKAQTWVDKGLIDGLKYRDEMEQYLCHLFGTTYPEDVKTVSIKKYINKLKKGSSSKKVAVIYADGEIVRSGGAIVGEDLAHKIAEVRADSSVKAVVFRVNSPGGEVVAADIIRREIELLQKDKPVIASYGSYAASGGYLISAGCDRIFTDNTTLTGSIGVFGMVPSLGKAIKKNLKVNPVSLGTNAHSNMSGGMEPMSEDELAWYQDEIEGIYDTFVNVVCDGREMKYEDVDAIAQGRVWAGKDALQIGLCDERGTLLDAIAYAADKVGLSKYKIVCYPEKKSFFDELMSDDSDKKDPLVQFKSLLTPGFKAIARMPYLTIDEIR